MSRKTRELEAPWSVFVNFVNLVSIVLCKFPIFSLLFCYVEHVIQQINYIDREE